MFLAENEACRVFDKERINRAMTVMFYLITDDWFVFNANHLKHVNINRLYVGFF